MKEGIEVKAPGSHAVQYTVTEPELLQRLLKVCHALQLRWSSVSRCATIVQALDFTRFQKIVHKNCNVQARTKDCRPCATLHL